MWLFWKFYTWLWELSHFKVRILLFVFLHKVWSLAMYEGTEGKTIPPGTCEVGDVHTSVALSLLLTPGQQPSRTHFRLYKQTNIVWTASYGYSHTCVQRVWHLLYSAADETIRIFMFTQLYILQCQQNTKAISFYMKIFLAINGIVIVETYDCKDLNLLPSMNQNKTPRLPYKLSYWKNWKNYWKPQQK